MGNIFSIFLGVLCFSGCIYMLFECNDFCCTIYLPEEDEIYLAIQETNL